MHPSRTDPVGIAPARPQAIRRKSRVDASTSSGSLAAPELQAERAARRLRGHVIVVGVGSVGTAVVRALCAKGVPTVVVDLNQDTDDFRVVQDLCPTIVGDARRPEVLVRAGIHHARCLLAVTSTDAGNPEISLVTNAVAMETRPKHRLPVVLRCFASVMARRINSVSVDYHVLSSAQLAAPVFIEKAMQPRNTGATEGCPTGLP